MKLVGFPEESLQNGLAFLGLRQEYGFGRGLLASMKKSDVQFYAFASNGKAPILICEKNPDYTIYRSYSRSIPFRFKGFIPNKVLDFFV